MSQTLLSREKGQWSPQKAVAWYLSKPWLIGCNYAPSTAVNQLEMWEQETFDLPTITRELGWARSIGFNTIRVFLHDLLWEHDQAGLIQRMNSFLTVTNDLDINVMFVLFDGVWNPQPTIGYKEYKPGVHNSGWLQSPGAAILKDLSKHDQLEHYVKGVIGAFANDERILCWDLFNEPDNPNLSSYGSLEPPDKAELSFSLLKKAFQWAREQHPSQPLTAGVWRGDWCDEKISALDRFMLASSDIISFHNYENADEMERRIKVLQRFDRPIICTEYMARAFNSTFEAIVPVLKKYNVGAYNWGLVAGKTQTTFPWDSWSTPYETPPLWFHDIFHIDGRPYREDEVRFLSSLQTQKQHG